MNQDLQTVDIARLLALSSIAAMRPWLYHVHVFSWKGTDRLPLSAKAESWKKYLKALEMLGSSSSPNISAHCFA